jgi:hypothetical protein
MHPASTGTSRRRFHPTPLGGCGPHDATNQLARRTLRRALPPAEQLCTVPLDGSFAGVHPSNSIALTTLGSALTHFDACLWRARCSGTHFHRRAMSGRARKRPVARH